MEQIKPENKIEYIVSLKDDFQMKATTIKRQFCGSLENISGTNLYFKLNGCNALVIVPHNKIEWMAPSKEFWDKGHNKEDIFDN